jgi:hypothetical protein
MVPEGGRVQSLPVRALVPPNANPRKRIGSVQTPASSLRSVISASLYVSSQATRYAGSGADQACKSASSVRQLKTPTGLTLD